MTIQNRIYQSQILGLQEDSIENEAAPIDEAQVDPSFITSPSGMNLDKLLQMLGDRFRLYQPGMDLDKPVEPEEEIPIEDLEDLDDMLRQREEELKKKIKELEQRRDRLRYGEPGGPAGPPEPQNGGREDVRQISKSFGLGNVLTFALHLLGAPSNKRVCVCVCV